MMFNQQVPLDVLACRVPHCSMPACEDAQMYGTPAHMYRQDVAKEYLQRALRFRDGLGLPD